MGVLSFRGRRVLSFSDWSGNARVIESKDLKPTNPSLILRLHPFSRKGRSFSFNFVDRAAVPSAAHPCPNRPREFRPSPVI